MAKENEKELEMIGGWLHCVQKGLQVCHESLLTCR